VGLVADLACSHTQQLQVTDCPGGDDELEDDEDLDDTTIDPGGGDEL
jgi:hypothetical protein